MAIASSHNKHVYTGNGATTRWPFTFAIHDATDILVYVTDPQGRISQITNNFFVDTGACDVLYPVSGDPLASGWKIALLRSIAMTQELDLVNQGAFYAEDVEKALDKLTMILQQHKEEIDRSIKVDITSSGQQELQRFADYANQAIASADAAANSETRASSSASQANEAAIGAAYSANSAAAAAATAFSASAPAYEATATYSYPQVVAYIDGNSYRCLVPSSTGEDLYTSPNWVRITSNLNDFFTYDENGDLQPSNAPTYSSTWRMDSNNDIMPK